MKFYILIEFCNQHCLVYQYFTLGYKIILKQKIYGNNVKIGLLPCNHCLSMLCIKLQKLQTFLYIYKKNFCIILNKMRKFDIFV